MDQYHRNCYPTAGEQAVKETKPYGVKKKTSVPRTAYDFSTWKWRDLVDFAHNPPQDVEARDWKNLAIELTKR